MYKIPGSNLLLVFVTCVKKSFSGLGFNSSSLLTVKILNAKMCGFYT